MSGDGTKVSDIEIDRVYVVVCDAHGVIGEPKTYAEAIRVRRDHFFELHRAEGADQ